MKKTSSTLYSREVLETVKELQLISYWQGFYIFSRTLIQIIIFPILYHFNPHPLVIIIGLFVIGARQASIYEINHEAAHYKFFKGAKANKYFSLVFCIIPFFHHVEVFSYVQWRRVHRLHHRYLMTEQDPNYLQRVCTGENIKPFSRVDILKAMLNAVFGSFYGFFKFKQDYVFPGGKEFIKHRYNHLRLLLPVAGDKEMNQELLFRWAGYIVIVFLLYLSDSWNLFLLFWLLPMYTTFPAILKFMDIMDHNWSDTSGDLKKNSNSRNVPWILRQFSSDLFRYYHREHHEFPMVPALNMPKLHELLASATELGNA